jgi:hypothetical protein
MDFKQYKGKNILAWLWYNADFRYGDTNIVCYVYPRILMKGADYDLIDSDDFPKFGRIEVRIQGGESAEDVYSRFGALVNIRINGDADPNYYGNNMYSLKYNPQYGKARSEIWIDSFSGKCFYQIIDVNNSIEKLQNQKEPSIPEPDCTIYTTLILLRYEGKLYGPFECDTKEGTTTLLGLKDYQYSVGEYNAIDYNDDILVIEDQNKEEALILIPKSSIPTPEECAIHFDWISERTLIDSFIDSLRTENSYTREQVRQLKDTIQQMIESGGSIQFTEERILKIQALLHSAEQKEACVRAIVQYALEDANIKQLLAEEVVTNYFDQIQNNITEISSVQRRVDELKIQEAALQDNIATLPKSTEVTRERESGEDSKKVSELTQELERIQAVNKALSEKVDLHEEIDQLIAERDQLKNERDKAKDSYKQQVIDNNELQKQFDSTLKTFNDRATQTARILDSKLLDKILRGIGDEPTIETPVQFNSAPLHTESMDYKDIIERVLGFVRDKAHRDVSSNDIANYLICITQGFITTFAGEPGTGKTSLCNILAKALGLVANAKQRRFVDISVERGWSSHKDFIGYYNPLSKKMERSNGEVFNAFELMDTECGRDKSEIAPFVILLDEANLSPIEHYWAAFLRNCDFGSISNRTIPLGGSKSFKLPDHLRFLATVNFDHTTEELSPRFLDRSWIIMLEPTRIDDESDEEIENFEDMISFAAMKAAFCIGKNDVIDEAIQNKWNAVQKIFRDHSLQIMPRNQKMVKNYCAVGCRCMERDTPATKYAPLDYAFSQKILPAINGNGENYRLLIEDLLKECTMQNMPISAKHLERMKRIAESNMGFYQFFSR